MQQDHVESKAEERSGRTPARAKGNADVTSQARAVLNLQNTAGNRAMARVLAPSAKGVPVQRAALSPVTVQRDELMDAIRSEYGQGEVLPVDKLARMIVRSLRASDRDSVEEPERRTEAEKPKKEETGGTEKPAVKVKKAEPSTTVPLTKEALAKKRQELHAREKSIREGPSRLEKQRDALKLREDRVKLDEQERALRRPKSPEEMEMLERGERLTALENEQTEAERLRKEEAELLRPESEGEKANQAKKAKLDEIKKRKEGDQDRAKKRKQIEEMKRKLSGQLTPEERADQELEDELAALKKEQDEAAKMRQFERERKPLNPQGKSLTQILGGRRF